MKVYLGRQPILDRSRNVAGYELLFRSSEANFCDLPDDVMATSQVIVNAVLGVGLDRLLGGKPAFINFDRTLLLGDWSTLLPPEKCVIEILETVAPDQEVLTACDNLRRQGYAIALDDCLDDERTQVFAPFVDILKVDFLQTSPAHQEKLARLCRKLKIRMVAEKVETDQEFRRAMQLGYDYFQGYFFARPTVLQAARVPASQMSGLRLMKQIQREELDFRAIEDLIRHDVSFSHSLLTYLNSAAFNWADRVESVRHGLFLLGSSELRKWAWMASLANLGQSRPPVLMAQVLMRGRFCEMIAGSSKLSLGEADPFLLGMFSLLDAILERPLAGILDDLNISPNLRDALLGTAGESDLLALVLKIVKSYEVGNWREVDAAAQVIQLAPDDLLTCYMDSVLWVDTVFPAEEQKAPAGSAGAPIDFRRDRDRQPQAVTH
ncbi:MAG TPA: EAL domain-containing protein [Bryobacteraceae bacterium]|jgi:EAL and modified HD-GYP domain-containing signal transduction protein